MARTTLPCSAVPPPFCCDNVLLAPACRNLPSQLKRVFLDIIFQKNLVKMSLLESVCNSFDNFDHHASPSSSKFASFDAEKYLLHHELKSGRFTPEKLHTQGLNLMREFRDDQIIEMIGKGRLIVGFRSCTVGLLCMRIYTTRGPAYFLYFQESVVIDEHFFKLSLFFFSLFFKNAGNLVIMTCLTEGVLPAWMYVIYKKHAAHALKDGPKAAADLPEHIVKLVDTLLLQVKTFLFVYPIYRGHCLPDMVSLEQAALAYTSSLILTFVRACGYFIYM